MYCKFAATQTESKAHRIKQCYTTQRSMHPPSLSNCLSLTLLLSLSQSSSPAVVLEPATLLREKEGREKKEKSHPFCSSH